MKIGTYTNPSINLRDHSTANSYLEKSNRTIDLKFCSTNSVHIDTTSCSVEFSLDSISSFYLFEFYRIASRFFFLSLFLLFFYVHEVLYRFSVSGRSIFLTPTFFFSRTLFVLSSFSIRLISPTFPATPHFLRNRFTFFVLSLPLSPSSCPYNSFLRGLLFHAPSSLLPIRFILPTRVFPFWLSGSLPRSLVALVYHSWLSYREIRWHAFTLCARNVTFVSFH